MLPHSHACCVSAFSQVPLRVRGICAAPMRSPSLNNAVMVATIRVLKLLHARSKYIVFVGLYMRVFSITKRYVRIYYLEHLLQLPFWPHPKHCLRIFIIRVAFLRQISYGHLTWLSQKEGNEDGLKLCLHSYIFNQSAKWFLPAKHLDRVHADQDIIHDGTPFVCPLGDS